MSEYKLEAARPRDASMPEEEREVIFTCGGPSPFETIEDVMKRIEEDLLLKAVADQRVAAFSSFWGQPEGFAPGYLITLKADTRNYVRDPFFFQWQQAQAQLEQTKWKTPIFTEESTDDINADMLRYVDPKMFEVEAPIESGPVCEVIEQTSEEIYLSYKRWLNADPSAIAKAASEMDWEEEEDITQPGLAPPEPVQEAVPAPAPSMGYPYVTTDAIMKTDRCYFCADQRMIVRFYRGDSDSLITCVNCLYDHLKQELLPGGGLRPVPVES